MQYEFGFIGVGNMGGALAEQVSKALPKGKVAVCDLDDKKTAAFRETYGDAVLSLDEIPSSCRFLVLGVKPQVLPGLLDKIASLVPPSTVVVSMAAGISIAAIEKTFANNPIIRIMRGLTSRESQIATLFQIQAGAIELFAEQTSLHTNAESTSKQLMLIGILQAQLLM